MDALGSAIRVDSRGREVMRVLPRVNEDSQRGVDLRQDPLRGRRPARQRLDRPMSEGRQAAAGELAEAFDAIAAKVKAAAPSASA
jgi:NADH dehydrogenase/NADH:ubiquinone oxidoreductase subunit G